MEHSDAADLHICHELSKDTLFRQVDTVVEQIISRETKKVTEDSKHDVMTLVNARTLQRIINQIQQQR